jgi:hypothetical protein
MAGITFRDIKDKRALDASFTLYSKRNEVMSIQSVDYWHKGDNVSVCFPDQSQLIKDILQDCPADFDFWDSGDLLQVKCVVVERYHSVVWRSVGQLETMVTTSVVLEAKDGYWEDVLKWVVIGQKPEWSTST